MENDNTTSLEIIDDILYLIKNSIELESVDTKYFADTFNYSEKQINRIFKNHSNLSLIKYHGRYKLVQATKYILKGNLMKDAAIKYGYTEQGLSKTFKKTYGVNVRDLKKGDVSIDLYKNLEIGDGI